LVCGARAVELRSPLEPGAGTGAACEVIRAAAGDPGPDRYLSPELRAVEQAVADGSLLAAVEAAIGELE